METLVVVTQKEDWSLDIPGAPVVTARSYLLEPEFASMRRVRVFNLCRHYRYQSYGYYVSLLAEARGHTSMPAVITMQDLRSPTLVRLASEELEEKIRKSLAPIRSDKFILSVYFGRNIAACHNQLSEALFRLFPAPFLRATFIHTERWELQNITAIPTSAIPEDHRPFVEEAITAFFARKGLYEPRRRSARFDVAILYEPKDPTSPSNQRAIDRFVRAGEAMGLAVEIIGRADYGRINQFDALFIRTTTSVDHFTYRFSRRATAEGLVVIDDPQSILRCTNKVFLAELLVRNGIPVPRTAILEKSGLSNVDQEIGYPCILKRPDSSSSLGVVKVENRAELTERATELFVDSDLLIVQEYLPTPFDWRICVIDGRPLVAAKYFMAPRHWQIIKHSSSGRASYGTTETLPVEEAPPEGVKIALKAANLIGRGLYGVDLKQVENRWYVIEVNDNPNIDHRIEDRFLKGELYRRIMHVILRRLEEQKELRGAQ